MSIQLPQLFYNHWHPLSQWSIDLHKLRLKKNQLKLLERKKSFRELMEQVSNSVPGSPHDEHWAEYVSRIRDPDQPSFLNEPREHLRLLEELRPAVPARPIGLEGNVQPGLGATRPASPVIGRACRTCSLPAASYVHSRSCGGP